MNFADALVIVMLVLVVSLAFCSMRKNAGKGCSGCCSSCGMSCRKEDSKEKVQ